MADPFGFIKIKEREEQPLRDTCSRINDYSDTYEHISSDKMIDIAQRQSSRCMDCGVPFCHFSCPLGNLIPEFNDLVYQKQWNEAYKRLQTTNNFPEFTGRVCPALCESGCVLGSISQSVTIKNIEKTISEIAFERGYVTPSPSDYNTDWTICIVGSGPAGLAAAQQLVRSGHTVVVYEKNDKPGGLLRYGIPNFKLEKSIIDRRIKQLEAEGVKFRCGIEVGKDGENSVSWQYLKNRFNVVLIAIGTGIPNDLNINGRNAKNVRFAMEYLTNSTKQLSISNNNSQKGENDQKSSTVTSTATLSATLSDNSPEYSLDSNHLNAKDKNVLIIGGGDTGSDCLGTALRQNAKSVTTLQIMPPPPQNRADSDFYGEQPWPTFPILNKPSTSIQEGKALGKSEILYETTVLELTNTQNSDDEVVNCATLAKVKWMDGKFTILEDTKWTIPVDLVLISVGFKGANTDDIKNELSIEIDSKSKIICNDNYQTSDPNIFACGDARRGQSLVVWAIAEGRSVAKAIDEYLGGETNLKSSVSPDEFSLKA